MLSEVKDTPTRSLEVGDLVGIHYYLRELSQEFRDLGVDPPEWLADKLAEVRRAIKYKNDAALEDKISKARKELDRLNSEKESMSEIAAEISRLEKIRDSL